MQLLSESALARSGEPRDSHVIIPRIGPSRYLCGQRYNLATGRPDLSLSIFDDLSCGLIVYGSCPSGSLTVDCERDSPERSALLRSMLAREDGDAAAALCESILAEYLQELACKEYQRALWYGEELACVMEMLDLLSQCEPHSRY